MTALWIIAAVFSCLIILFLIPVRAHISVVYREDETDSGTEFEIRYMFLRFKLFPSEKKEKKEKQQKKISPTDAFEFFTEIYDDLKTLLYRFLNYTLKHAVTIYGLNLSAEIGCDEAMRTGMCIGTANAAAYGVTAAMQRNMKLKDYNISIVGNFERKCLNFGVRCVIGTNVMHILVLLFAVMGTLLKIFSKWRIKNDDKSGNRDA